MENEEKNVIENFIDNISNKENVELTYEDEEFEKYCKLYEERFGKRAYIAEPSGTKQKTIDAIKICLEKNEDILDQLLYSNNNSDYIY